MIRVKICGITNAADAFAAIEAGANLLGFNFYAKSPRHITEGEAAKIRRQLPKKIKAVGIFVNAPPVDVAALCKSLKLDAARSEEHTSELQSQSNLVCRLLLEKKNKSAHARTTSISLCPAIAHLTRPFSSIAYTVFIFYIFLHTVLAHIHIVSVGPMRTLTSEP